MIYIGQWIIIGYAIGEPVDDDDDDNDNNYDEYDDDDYDDTDNNTIFHSKNFDNTNLIAAKA